MPKRNYEKRKPLKSLSALFCFFIFFSLAVPVFGALDPSDLEPSSSVSNFEGYYSGTATGEDSGNWSMTITSEGECYGETYSNSSEISFSLTGTISNDGKFTWTAGGSFPFFSGTIDSNGTVSGTWEGGGYSGMFSGSKSDTITEPDGPGSGDGGETQSPPPCGYDVAGQWSVTINPVSCDCNNNCPTEPELHTVAVTQNGCEIIMTENNETRTAVLDGNEFSHSFVLTGTSDAGIPWEQTHSYHYTLVNDSTLKGTLSIRHEDRIQNCDVMLNISGNKDTGSQPLTAGAGGDSDGGSSGCFIDLIDSLK